MEHAAKEEALVSQFKEQWKDARTRIQSLLVDLENGNDIVDPTPSINVELDLESEYEE